MVLFVFKAHGTKISHFISSILWAEEGDSLLHPQAAIEGWQWMGSMEPRPRALRNAS